MFAYGETATRLRRQMWTDPYSGETAPRPWDDGDHEPDALPIEGVAFNPGGSTDLATDGRTIVTTKPTAYCPIDADILAGDRLQVRGVTYDVEGNPAEWRNPFTGWAPGLAVTLELVEG